MRNFGVKEYNPDSSRNFVELIWTNLALKTSLSPLSSLMITGASTMDDNARLSAELAAHLARQKKKVLLIDFNRQGLRFKKLLNRDFDRGFTDFLHHVFNEPFLSRNVNDYGFADLIALCHFNRRSGQVFFIPEDDDPVAIRFYEGYPVDIVNASKTLYNLIINAIADLKRVNPSDIETALSALKNEQLHYTDKLLQLALISREALCSIYDIQVAGVLKTLSSKSFISFDFAGQPNEIYESVRHLFPKTPAFLRMPFEKHGHILNQLAKCTVPTDEGFTFFPMGQFPAKKGELARQLQDVIPLLKRQFDFILVNAPKYDSDSITTDIGQILSASLLVIKNGTMERRHLRSLMNSMRENDLNLVGAVLSDVPSSNRIVI